MSQHPTHPWYRNGLRFRCTGCGSCCTGAPGTVRVGDAEIEAMSTLLGFEGGEFRRLYTRPLRRGDVGLVEKREGECIFWDRRAGCRVYETRPRQCRTWPFWRAVLHSPETWAAEAQDCPGMNAGTLHCADTIAALATRDGTSRD